MLPQAKVAAVTVTLAALAALGPSTALGQITAPPPPPPPPPPPVAQPAPPPPPPPPPAGPQTLAPATADALVMAKNIRAAMAGQAFGWQFAIAQHGKFVTADADGTARSAIDNGGTRTKMKPTIRYEIASLTKNVVAVSTMKLLRVRGLTVNRPVGPFLPAGWERGPGFRATDAKKVTFGQLLTHTSGIQQAMKTNACKDVCGNDWDGLRALVKVGVVPESPRVYKNANYALLRVLDAKLWKAAGGKVIGYKTVYVETTNWKGDEIKKPKQVPYVLPVDEATHARYAMDHIAKRVLGPAGITNVGCVAGDPSTAGLSYPAGATQQTKGRFWFWPASECAGNAGLRLTSIEIVRYLAHLRHGTIIDPKDLATMDALRAGWREASNLGAGTPPGVYWHGGELQVNKVTTLHTCGITFPDGTEASIIVNSAMSLVKCRVLRDAWIAAH